MSAFKFNCPHCEQRLEVPEDLFGQKIDCPACQGRIQLAETEAKQSPAPKNENVPNRPAAASDGRPAARVHPNPAGTAEAVGGRQIVGFVGCILLMVGVFMPIASAPAGGSVPLMQSSSLSGIVLLVLAALSLFALLIKKDAFLWFSSIACLGTLTLGFVDLQLGLRQILTAAGSSEGLFSGLAGLSAEPGRLQWGWAVLLAGALLSLLPLFIKSKPKGASRQRFFKLGPGWRMSGGFLSLLCGIAMALTVAWPSAESGQQPQTWSERLFGRSSTPGDSSPGRNKPLFGLNNPATEFPDWDLRMKPSDEGAATIYLLSRDALPPLGVGYLQTPPTLTIRYEGGTLTLTLGFDVFLGSASTMVTSGFDPASGTKKEWTLSADGKRIIFPGTSDAFVRKLMANDRLFIRLTPFGESPSTFRFDLTGLPEQIDKMRNLMKQDSESGM